MTIHDFREMQQRFVFGVHIEVKSTVIRGQDLLILYLYPFFRSIQLFLCELFKIT